MGRHRNAASCTCMLLEGKQGMGQSRPVALRIVVALRVGEVPHQYTVETQLRQCGDALALALHADILRDTGM